MPSGNLDDLEVIANKGFTQVVRVGYTDTLAFDVSAFETLAFSTECGFYNPCGNPLLGVLRVAPRLGRADVDEIVARDWAPRSAIEVVCQLNPGQESKLTGACQTAP